MTSVEFGVPVRDDAVNVGIALAEQFHRVARRTQIAFRGLLVGCRLLHLTLRDCPRREQAAQAIEILAVEIQHTRCGNQRRLRLQQIGTAEREQRLAFFDVVPDFAEQCDDPALIGREDLNGHVLVEIDAANRFLLDREIARLDRLDLDRGKL